MDLLGFFKSRLRVAYRHYKAVANILNSKRSVRVAKALEKSSDPVQLFSSLQKKVFISENILWQSLLYLSNRRNPIYDLIAKHKDELSSAEIKYLVSLCEGLSSPSPVSIAKVEEFITFYSKNRGKLKNESDYRRLLITFIVKKVPSSQAYNAFSRAGLMDKITVHQVLKVLRRASVERECAVFNNLKKQYLNEMTPAALVKVKYWESQVEKNCKLKYKELETEFCQLEKALSKEYEEYLLPLFSAIPVKQNMLDFYIEASKYHKLKNELEETIRQEDSYSFVRLNDGEGYGFPDALPCAFDMERQELHWWGEVLATDLREKIQEDFRRSMRQHDIVGIPSVFRFIDELSINRDYSIFNNALLCRLFTLCHGYLSEYRGESYITEGQINLYLFDKGFIDRLSSLARHVVFISGAKKEYLQRVFSDLQHASYIELPTHRLLKAEKFSYSEAAQPLPYVYEDYIEQIRGLSGPGVVFFISAGFIGKIFAAEVAKNGGVALDVGQTLMNIVANHGDA
ncbi:hypothetical protein [Billgrantia bachuensis]|uniref:Uncharacterized protein n=1 Tax=Billgrantia bachuensis TaxID=2717286 RepID=A0ABX0PM19_9GAMM|nr:hypothetical protein [Halomonas bachuensis]NIC04158.1 hypothetical protein [Halomonas bachuensis]